MVLVDRLYTSSYSSFILTMAPSCIASEIKRDIGRKSRFFIHHLYSTTLLRGNLSEFRQYFSSGQISWNLFPPPGSPTILHLKKPDRYD